jgi:hypothetical protein
MNDYGQLGMGTNGSWQYNSVAAAALSGTPISIVGVGSAHTCVLAAPSDGNKVLCFGWGAYGNLGNSKTEKSEGPQYFSAVPVNVQGLRQSPRIKQLAVGSHAACVLYDASTASSDEPMVQCWGLMYEATATSVLGTTKATTLAVGKAFTVGCIIDNLKTVSCWDAALSVKAITGLKNAVHISSGGGLYYSTDEPVGCAIVQNRGTSGSLWCWGHDRLNGLLSNSSTPWQVQGLPGSVVDAVVGRHHACALVDAGGGQVYCWGSNQLGQLGQGYTNGTYPTYEGSSVPLRVKGVSSVTSLFGNTPIEDYTCAKMKSQRVFCWGASPNYEVVSSPTALRGLCA